MTEDNWSRQVDEVEALSAIYDDQFKVVDSLQREYSVRITDGRDNPLFHLRITFSPDYPSDAPPTYRLDAPWLSDDEKIQISNSLEEIYCDNIGESIVYKWVEAIREFLTAKTEAESEPAATKKVDKVESLPVASLEISEEDDGTEYYDEYGFDPQLHVYHSSASVDTGHSTGADIALPTIHHGEFIKDRKSVFQGHLAAITHKAQVEMVMDELKTSKKIVQATHRIIAYRIDCGKDVFITGCEDDGEIHAGSRMLHLLNIVDARNVMVVVTRWYGGVHLGPDRFKHINNCTRELLEAHGYIKDKGDGKKGPKSSAGDASESSSQVSRTTHGQKHGKKGK